MMSANQFDSVEGGVTVAKRNINEAGNDIAGRDKITSIDNSTTYNYYTDTKKTNQAPAIPISRLMPYLPNRLDQELELGKRIKHHLANANHSKHPLICIIHGEENQCCDMFMERIIYQSLKKIIPEKVQHGLKKYHLSCDTFKDSQELHTKMQMSLAIEVLGNMFADLTKIAQTLAQQKMPILLCVNLSTEVCVKQQGIQVIDFFLAFWKNWLAVEQQQHLLLVCLCFDYRPIKQSFLMRLRQKNEMNQQIRAYLKTLDFKQFNLHGVVLPELNPIEQCQVEDWARLHLNHCYEKLRPKIKQLFAQHKQSSIAMQPLAEHLAKILQELV